MKEFFKKLFENMTQDLDNPDPIHYARHAPLVWAQVKMTLETAHMEFDKVRIRIDHTNHQPVTGKPLEIHATIDLNHKELRSVREFLPDEDKDLQSRIFLKAFIQPIEAKKCHLILKWKVQNISLISRSEHDKIITTLTELMDKNIKEAGTS